MLDHTRSNAILLTAVAFYLATSLVRLHASQPTWHPIGVSMASVVAAVKQGIIETTMQADGTNVFIPGT